MKITAKIKMTGKVMTILLIDIEKNQVTYSFDEHSLLRRGIGSIDSFEDFKIEE